MARIRSLKPEFWSDRKLARLCSRDARMLYMALWNQADEHARLLGDPRWIKGVCFPFDDDLGPEAIDRLLDELVAAGCVVRYEVDGDPYLYLPKLAKHQRLESAKVPSRLPPPPPEVEGPDGTPPAGPPESRTGRLEPRAGSSESRADKSARRADECAPSYVAGSRDQGSGSRDQVAGSRVLPVGQLARRNARARSAPSAQPGESTPGSSSAQQREARAAIDAIPRYRGAPGWVRRELVTYAAEALGEGFGPEAIVRYAEVVAEPGRFKDRQHIPEFRDVLRRLRRDVELGTVCACCGVPPKDCQARLGAADRPWTPEDEADLQRARERLGVVVPMPRSA